MTVSKSSAVACRGGTFSEPSSHAFDRVEVRSDDPNLVANAGLVLVGTMVVRLELERLVDSLVRLTGRVGGARRAGRC